MQITCTPLLYSCFKGSTFDFKFNLDPEHVFRVPRLNIHSDIRFSFKPALFRKGCFSVNPHELSPNRLSQQVNRALDS